MLAFRHQRCPPRASISIRFCGRTFLFLITVIRDRNRRLLRMGPVMGAVWALIKARELAKEMAQASGREPRATLVTMTKAPVAVEAADRRATIQVMTSIGSSDRPK